MDVAQPLRRKLRRAGTSPGHHASDIFTVFPEEQVGKTGHTGVPDVPPDYLLVKAHCLAHVIGDKFVPDEAVSHFAPSLAIFRYEVNIVHIPYHYKWMLSTILLSG